jgi:hypothetical protein
MRSWCIRCSSRHKRGPYKRKPETERPNTYYSAEQRSMRSGFRFQVCGGGFRIIRKGT